MDNLELNNNTSICNISDLIKKIPTITIPEDYLDKCRKIKICYKKVNFGNGKIFNTNINIAIKYRIIPLIQQLIKFFPINWIDDIYNIKSLSKIQHNGNWMSNIEIFYNIKNYVNTNDYSLLIEIMIEEFGLKQPNKLLEILLKGTTSDYDNFFRVYDQDSRYIIFVSKCKIYFYIRKLLALNILDPQIKLQTKSLIEEIALLYPKTGVSEIEKTINIISNTNISDDDKLSEIKNYWTDIVEFLEQKELYEWIKEKMPYPSIIKEADSIIEWIDKKKQNDKIVINNIRECRIKIPLPNYVNIDNLKQLGKELVKCNYFDHDFSMAFVEGVIQGEHIQWLENNRIGFMRIFQRIINRKSFKSDLSILVSKIFINKHKKPMTLATIGGMENNECERLHNLNKILDLYFPEK